MTKKFILYIIFATLSASLWGYPSANAQVLPSPAGLAPNDINSVINNFPITLSWSQVQGANAGYEYEVLNQGAVVANGKRFGQFNASVQIGAEKLTMGSIMQWRVRACATFAANPFGADGDCGFSSSFASFKPTLATPQLISPSDNATAPFPVELSWSTVSGASSYFYSVGTQKIDNKTASNITASGQVFAPATKITIDQKLLAAGQTYFWNIIARPVQGSPSTSSDVRSLTTGFPKPTGLSPSGLASLPVKLKWTFPAKADEFKWYIIDAQSQKEVMPAEIMSGTLIGDFFFSRDITNLPLNQDLQWMVQACSSSSKKCGPISDPLNFKVVLAKPQITKPEKDSQAIESPYAFAWNKVEGAANYEYVVSNAINPAKTEQLNAVLPENYLTKGQSYIFQVRACQKDGLGNPINCGEWAQRSFTTASLSVLLSADSSNIYTNTNIKLTASTSGPGTGATANYTFYCNRTDNGTNITNTQPLVDYSGGKNLTDGSKVIGYKIDTSQASSFTTPPICGNIYDTPGRAYIAKVIVQRGALSSQSTLEIKVSANPTGLFINPSSLESLVGKQMFVSSFYDSDGQGPQPVQNKTGDSAWTVSDDKIIKLQEGTITEAGNLKKAFTCSSEGSAKITAVWNNVSTTAAVACKPAPTAPTAGTGDGAGATEAAGGAASGGGSAIDQNKVDYCVNLIKTSCTTAKPCPVEGQNDYLNSCNQQSSVIGYEPLTNAEKQQVLGTLTAVFKGTSKDGGVSGGGNASQGEGFNLLPGFKFIPCGQSNQAVSNNAIQNPLCADNIQDLINNIVVAITWIAIVATPLMAIVAAFYFITYNGDPARIKKARDIIFYTVIGLVVIFLARALAYLVIRTITS